MTINISVAVGTDISLFQCARADAELDYSGHHERSLYDMSRVCSNVGMD